MFSPLEQFKVNVLWQLQVGEYSFPIVTNVTYTSVLLVLAMLYLVIIPMGRGNVVASKFVVFQEDVYKFIMNMCKSSPSPFILSYVPWILVMFYFVWFSNLLGLLPYGFTLTSQILMTFACSVSTFIGIVLLGLWLNKFDFMKYFIPNNVPNKALFYFLILMEVLSYLMSPFSLGIRLFANMLAGHTLLYMLANFSYSVAINFVFLSLLVPFMMIFGVILLEVSIAFMQTYVFTVLTILYMKDTLDTIH